MAEVDRIMMDELHVPVELMMEHAGLCLARAVVNLFDGAIMDIVVVVGSGNNGGGGLVAARRLIAWGHSVHVIVPKGIEKLRPVPRRQLTRASSVGAHVTEGLPDSLNPKDSSLLLDAYLGYGFTIREDSVTAGVFEYLKQHPKVIALDAPSGLDVTTGESISSLKPEMTLTIAFVKSGLLLTASENIGRLLVCDIGVPTGAYETRLGIDWSPPFKRESLVDLNRAFANSPIQEVDKLFSEEDETTYWLPRPQMSNQTDQ
ncbi:MAG: NAD(P)H-hydrate epimerase [Candidatus Thorarchaeota archaeon]